MADSCIAAQGCEGTSMAGSYDVIIIGSDAGGGDFEGAEPDILPEDHLN